MVRLVVRFDGKVCVLQKNLSAYDRSILALKLKPVIAAKAKENQQLSEGRGQKGCQISDNLNIDTKKEIARAAGVSHDTIAKVEKIEQQATPEIKAELKSEMFTYAFHLKRGKGSLKIGCVCKHRC